jgi:hypothetical protein
MDAAFFLTTGDQAPFSSPDDVLNLTHKELAFWVQKLSDMYKQQQAQMAQNAAKNRSKGSRRRR